MLVTIMGIFTSWLMKSKTKIAARKIVLSSEARLYFQLGNQNLPEIKEDKNYLSITFKDFPPEKFSEVEEVIAALGNYRQVKTLPFNQNDKLELGDKYKIYNCVMSNYEFTIMYNSELKQADIFLKIK
jgi:hypothetical protein